MALKTVFWVKKEQYIPFQRRKSWCKAVEDCQGNGTRGLSEW